MLNIFAKDIDIRYHSLVTSITEVGEETGVVVEEEEGASARRSHLVCTNDGHLYRVRRNICTGYLDVIYLKKTGPSVDT